LFWSAFPTSAINPHAITRCGRGLFQKCVGIAKKKLRPHDSDPNTSDWRFVSYCVFDAPHVKGDFETRYNFLKTIIKGSHSPACVLVGVEKCVGIPDLRKKLDEVEAVGGEGLMLRKPHSPYQQGRCGASGKFCGVGKRANDVTT
jgi:DNA ligase 1